MGGVRVFVGGEPRQYACADGVAPDIDACPAHVEYPVYTEYDADGLKLPIVKNLVVWTCMGRPSCQ